MPGVPNGCCGEVKPSEDSKIVVSPKEQNQKDIPKNENNNIEYGAKEPCCCCSSRSNNGSRNP